MKNGWKRLLVTGVTLFIFFGLISSSFAADSFTGGSSTVIVPEVNFTDLSQAAWAEKNIIRMKLRGIVDGYKDGTYRPNAAVTQAEAVVMAVKELGLEEQVASANLANTTLPAEFGPNIPAWARGYVAVAWQKGLIKASENIFKWNAPASRAWIAQLAVRVIGLEQEALQMNSALSNFTDDRDFPDWARGDIAIALEKEIFAGYSDGTFRPARAVTRAELATILAKSEQYMNLNDVLYGVIEHLNADNFIFDDTNHNLYRFYIVEGSWIFNGNEKIEYRDLQEGEQAVLVLAGPNTAGFIDVLNSDGGQGTAVDSNTVNGEVVEIDTVTDEIRIEDKNGKRTTYDIDSDVDVIIDGDSNPLLSDINVGDEVELRLSNSTATRIEVLTGNDMVEGEVVRVDTDLNEIRIEDKAGDRTTYDIDSDVDIIIDGDSNPRLVDINVGETVELQLANDDTVTRIEVVTGDDIIEGEVIRVDTATDEIRIEDSAGDRTTYDIDSDVDININGDSNPSLSDINVGNQVELEISGGKVTRIEVVTENSDFVVGDLYRVTESDRSIRVEAPDGDRTTYTVDVNADIQVPGNTNAGFKDLVVGNPVKLVVVNDEVTEIILGKLREGIVHSVDEADDTVEVERTTGSTATYELSHDVVIEHGSSSLDISDLNVNDEVQLYIFDDQVYLIVVN